MAKYKDDYWIGGNDRKQEGTWRWADGSFVGYTNWRKGEPNNSGNNEDCVQLSKDGRWNDNGCSKKYRFACEKWSGKTLSKGPRFNKKNTNHVNWIEVGGKVEDQFTLPPDFGLSFDLIIDRKTHKKDSSVFVISKKGTKKDCCSYGDRLLGMWMHKQQSTKFHLVAGHKGNGNEWINPKYKLPYKKWFRMWVRVYGKELLVFAGKKLVARKTVMGARTS